MSKLYFRYAAMNAGKSTALIQVAHNYSEQGYGVAVLKPATDTKAETVSSRTGLSWPVDAHIAGDTDILDVLDSLLNVAPNSSRLGCVLVDEAQFLTPVQVDDLLRFAATCGVPVLTYGLRTDFQGRAFPGSRRLLEVADVLEELKTVCKCGLKATFNARKVGDRFVREGAQVAIDGQEASYESLCAKCYVTNVGLSPTLPTRAH